MSETGACGGGDTWRDPLLAAALFAIDPAGLRGIVLRARSGPAREAFLSWLTRLLPEATPLRRVPIGVPDSRLLGGLDLTETLRLGRPVAERGLLAESDGGIILLAMAERLEPVAAARIAATLDTAEVSIERDGLALKAPARFGVVALDEGASHDERAPAALTDRLGFLVDLSEHALRDFIEPPWTAADIAAARARLGAVDIDAATIAHLNAAAMALGVESLRALLLAAQSARAAAALAGRTQVSTADAACAAALVLAPRAQTSPSSDDPPQAPEQDDGDSDAPPDSDGETVDPSAEELVVEAARAAVPPGMMERLQRASSGPRGSGGKSGGVKRSGLRGRPAGAVEGAPKDGQRLNVIETLRAAAPWRKLRGGARAGGEGRLPIERQDFRVTRVKQRSQTVTIFVVDASGSSALNRLAEAKGAVELLLAECYVRRDEVALLAFRGDRVELLLAPTRSLLRAKRSLSDMPGGGATPLADGITAAVRLAEDEKRKGRSPFIVLMTDGAANISAGGMAAGRKRAKEDALDAARLARAAGLEAALIDISPRPQPDAERLAAEMNARYLPLPFADASALAQAARRPPARFTG
ncbi:von Willebrand factor type A [Methylocella silvestris BL2]|uniref:von Willebrand factor type A n=1 Tax=Methylocella silvestris (strain DSM 15510 / CIP 108128 / LMG 27833 / NCIMB 13906 / BL2) TaxID=395965 RepID=B8EQ03_METSB|nr:magnesium chelatase subunit D [Methylocella silvestris]ACK51007.1 von Willebrand factor type A [Methylocella silvestris BL2]